MQMTCRRPALSCALRLTPDRSLCAVVRLAREFRIFTCIKFYLIACLIWTILPSFGNLALLTVSRARPLAYM